MTLNQLRALVGSGDEPAAEVHAVDPMMYLIFLLVADGRHPLEMAARARCGSATATRRRRCVTLLPENVLEPSNQGRIGLDLLGDEIELVDGEP